MTLAAIGNLMGVDGILLAGICLTFVIFAAAIGGVVLYAVYGKKKGGDSPSRQP